MGVGGGGGGGCVPGAYVMRRGRLRSTPRLIARGTHSKGIGVSVLWTPVADKQQTSITTHQLAPVAWPSRLASLSTSSRLALPGPGWYSVRHSITTREVRRLPTTAVKIYETRTVGRADGPRGQRWNEPEGRPEGAYSPRSFLIAVGSLDVAVGADVDRAWTRGNTTMTGNGSAIDVTQIVAVVCPISRIPGTATDRFSRSRSCRRPAVEPATRSSSTNLTNNHKRVDLRLRRRGPGGYRRVRASMSPSPGDAGGRRALGPQRSRPRRSAVRPGGAELDPPTTENVPAGVSGRPGGTRHPSRRPKPQTFRDGHGSDHRGSPARVRRLHRVTSAATTPQ